MVFMTAMKNDIVIYDDDVVDVDVEGDTSVEFSGVSIILPHRGWDVPVHTIVQTLSGITTPPQMSQGAWLSMHYLSSSGPFEGWACSLGGFGIAGFKLNVVVLKALARLFDRIHSLGPPTLGSSPSSRSRANRSCASAVLDP